MRVAVSGASGKTGFRVAEEALKNNFKVRLLVRETSVVPESLNSAERRQISLSNPESFDEALSGCDSLVIATGARPTIDLTGPCRIDAKGVTDQINSCKRVGVNRVILVSSLCCGKLFHPLNLFGLILLFKRIGERALEQSGLDWTIIRPGGLNENEESLESQSILYGTSGSQEEGSIPRRLVAKSCIEALKIKSSIRQIVEVTSNQETPRISMEDAIATFKI